MELKETVGIVVAIVVLFLIYTAGSKNDYKKKKSILPFCLQIPFTGHEICIRPYTPKTKENKVKTSEEQPPQSPQKLKRLKNKHQQYHNNNTTGRKHKQLHKNISKEEQKKLHSKIRVQNRD